MSKSAQGTSPTQMGCGFAVVLIGLAIITGTVMSNIPSLGAPVRLQLTAAAPTLAQPTQPQPVSPVPTESLGASPELTPTTAVALPSLTPLADNPWVTAIPEAACIPTDIPQTGLVTEVVDAETIRVLMDRDGLIYAVRYLGVDVPSSIDPHVGLSGVQRNIQLTYDRHVLLVRDLTDKDAYGRLLRYVMVGRTFVNYALIAAGFARAESTPPDTSCYAAFQAVEQQAQSQNLGIWAPSH